MFSEKNIKKILLIVGAVVTLAAAVFGVGVLVKKLTAKKKEEEFYIECDCSDDEELSEDSAVTVE